MSNTDKILQPARFVPALTADPTQWMGSMTGLAFWTIRTVHRMQGETRCAAIRAARGRPGLGRCALFDISDLGR